MTDTRLDAELRREVYRQRFASYLVNEYIKPTAQELSRSIPRILSDYDFPDVSRREVNQVNAAIRQLFNERWSGMWESIRDELRELGIHEAEALQELYSDLSGKDVTKPAGEVLIGAMNAAAMTLVSGERVDAGVWDKFIRKNNTATYNLIDGVIRIGQQEGMTNQEITREIRGSYNRSTKSYQGGILQGRATQWAETLARTGVSHYANTARERTIQANSDILERRILVATHDNRTTFICRSRHLQEWPVDDDNYPRLPFHFNERSVYLFLFPGEKSLDGTVPAIGGKATSAKDYRERPRYRGRRDSGIYDVEQVSANVSQSQWLKRQPRAFVRSALGDTRAKLFLDGKLDIDSFVDMQGRPLTLNELRQTTAGERAFRRAGLTGE